MTTSHEDRLAAAARAADRVATGEHPDDSSNPIARSAAWADASWLFWLEATKTATPDEIADAESGAEAAEAAAAAIADDDPDASDLCGVAGSRTVLAADAWDAWFELELELADRT